MTDDATVIERVKDTFLGMELTREFDVTDDDADMLAQALLPLVRELHAGAWDEGYWGGFADGSSGYGADDRNPYRSPDEKAGE